MIPQTSEPLARLLSQWGVPARAAAPLSGGLAWLGWTDAIRLSQALGAAPITDATTSLAAALDWAQAALERVLADLREAIADAELSAESAQPLPERPLPLADSLAPYRLHHAQTQRRIEARVVSLRERLRLQLTETGNPRLAHLAALDAVFDPALADHERHALSAMAALLTRRAEAHRAADPRGWRSPFWADQQRALRAELDLRLQPVLGLIEALHQEMNR